MPALTIDRPHRRPAADFAPMLRGAMLLAGGALFAACLAAVLRHLAGLAPDHGAVRSAAVVVHVGAVLPALPLGLTVLLTRKGGARHKLLGRIWMALMLVTALSALFIRHLNHGSFSWIHLFVPLAVVTIVRAVAAARRGDILAHKRHLAGMFLGALLIPGLFSFMPGRMMGAWLFG